MSKPLIVVTGKNGQLGWELEKLAAVAQDGFDILFTGREELDLGKPATIPLFFEKYKPAYFINCAAYTAVDKAETEQEQAYTINTGAVGIIAQQCRLTKTTLISFSTDYVFDGKGKAPYPTDTPTEPINYYGYTKCEGEKLALANNPKTIIIRTSWLYSTHGNNFVKTMMRLMKERAEIKVVSDQVGSPTYAADLAGAIFQIVSSLKAGNEHYGIYHYSNTGVLSWYEFATAIRDEAGLTCKVIPITTAEYPTPAKRPGYSVMDTQEIVNDFGVGIMDWKKSLGECIHRLKS